MLRTRPQPGNETWPFEERNCYGHAFTPSLCVPSDGAGLALIDECTDEILFFADEGGSWEVGVDWEIALPAWFRVLSATAGPSEYAQRISMVLKRHYKRGRIKMLAVARKIATPAQRQALPERESEGAIRGSS
jgi:hypothetical protein